MNPNVETANKFLNDLRNSKFETLPSYLTDDATIQGASGATYNKEVFEKYFIGFENPFSDVKVEHVRTLIIDNTVIIESIESGVQIREYNGIPPSDKRYKLPTIHLFDFEEGKIKVWKEYMNSKILLDLNKT